MRVFSYLYLFIYSIRTYQNSLNDKTTITDLNKIDSHIIRGYVLLNANRMLSHMSKPFNIAMFRNVKQ